MNKPCDCFLEISGQFYFHITEINDIKHLVMPHLFVDSKVVRVNFCPVCGEGVRIKDIEFKP